MKDFIKKKMYLILLIVSFSTLFSAILYAQAGCEFDDQCPEGMICVIPGNFCILACEISCTQNPILNHLCYCYEPKYPQLSVFTVDCKFTGQEVDHCIPMNGPWQPYY